MRHLAPRQKAETGLWHYTSSSRHGPYAIGPCSPLEVCPSCPSGGTPTCGLCSGHGVVKSQEPCPGHETAEGACEHYREGLLAGATFHGDLPEDRPRTVSRCAAAGCETLCSGYARVGQDTIPLCAEHRNSEVLPPLVSVWETFES